jgi:transcriptional regulator with XRE-family HTH domain
MQPLESQFGAVIRRRREKLGLSQEDFADKAGIHRTYISAIELGKVAISIVIAKKLADTLGVPVSRLFQDVEKA